ncbi:DUF3043 family protein [Barrientosiimonas humi]|uniref:DUF3043 family protein n=2 Tax=Barrientosiimonas TaxID=1535207 RepID=A0A542XAN7_9MICO|nr:DUF3043 family protein [Barrientosiimonas humi]BDZ57721.1 hypothetical protein GCM10025872_13780 [Barrientosiimonas endolithica]CAG7572881.1 hypothetical protein BH39T_PBIAJDOK_01505 [Barrientosiimonas humi]
MCCVLGRKKNQTPATDPAPTEEAVTEPGQPGKGRPTPKRREQEAARRKPLVPADREAAKKQSKEQARASRLAQREAMNRGDESALPPRDRGPIKKFIRNSVDSRLSVGEILLPLMLIVLVLMFVRLGAAVQLAAMILVWGIVIAGILDAVLMWRRTKKAIVEKFGQEPPKGSASYAIMRSFQMRISRVPRPQVARGDKDWKNAR